MFFKKHVLDSTKQVCCVRPFLVVRAAARWPLAPTAGGCFGGVFEGRVGRDGGHLRGHGRGFGAFWVCWLLGERHSRCSLQAQSHASSLACLSCCSLSGTSTGLRTSRWPDGAWLASGLSYSDVCCWAARVAGQPNAAPSGRGSTLLRDRIDLPEAFKLLPGGKNPSNSTRTQLCCSWCS